MKRAASAGFLLAVLFSPSGQAQEAGSVRLVAKPFVLPALELGRPGALPVLLAAPAPEGLAGGGLVVLSELDQRLYHVPWMAAPAVLATEPAGDASSTAPVLAVTTAGDQLVLTRGSQNFLYRVSSGALAPAGALPAVVPSTPGLVLLGSHAWIPGPPVIAQADETPRWQDSGWRRSRARRDCGLFVADLERNLHRPVICDPVFDSPTGRILAGGAVVASTRGDRVFAVAAARPFLTIARTDGEVLADVSHLEDGEPVPAYSEDDERRQFAGPDEALAVRDRFPAFQGLARWPDAVGLVVRRSDGKSVRFTLDVFSPQGVKLADDLPIPVPPGGLRAHLLTVNLTDGRVLAIFRDRRPASPGTPWSITHQEIIQLDLVAQAPDAAAKSLRLALRDALTSEPVTLATATLARGRFTDHAPLADSEGRHRVPLLAGEGPLRLTLEANGYAAVQLTLPPAQADEGGDLGTIFLDPGIVVEGTLADAATGEPLPGGRIRAVRRHPWGSLAARWLGSETTAGSDATGAFRLGGLEGGSVCLEIEHAATASRAVAIASLDPSGRHDLGTVWLGSGTLVRGRVIDRGGTALEGVRVEVRAGPWRNPCLRRATSSDGDGRFEFPAMSPGEYTLLAFDGKVVQALRPVSVGSQAVDAGDLRLEQRRFEGTVRMEGEPEVSGLLVLETAGAEGFEPPPVFVAQGGGQQLVSDLAPRLAVQVRPREAGRGEFAIRGYLPHGPAVASFTPDEDPAVVYRTAVEIPAADGPVRLTLELAGAPLTGTVEDEAGSGVAGVRVAVLANDVAIREVSSTQDGRFEVPRLPPGTHRLRAVQGDRRAEALAEAGEDVSLRLRPEDTTRLVVTVEGGARDVNYLGAVIYLTDGRGLHRMQRLDATRDAAGEAVFLGLEPGNYQLAGVIDGVLTVGPQLTLGVDSGTQRVTFERRPGRPSTLHLDEEFIGKEALLRSGNGRLLSPLLGYLGFELRPGGDGSLDLPPLARGRWLLDFPSLGRTLAFRVGSAGDDDPPSVVELR